MPRPALPSTNTGRWSLLLSAAFILLFVGHMLLFAKGVIPTDWRPILRPAYSTVLLSCGLAAGILGFVALRRHHDRAWLLWLTIIPPLMVVAFIFRIVRPPTQ